MAAQLVGWAPDASITALRFTNVVAEDEYATFDRAGEPDYRRDLLGSWVDARDGAEAVALALANARPGFEVYNVAAADSGNTAPSREVAAALVPRHPARRRPRRVRVADLDAQDPGAAGLRRPAQLALIRLTLATTARSPRATLQLET